MTSIVMGLHSKTTELSHKLKILTDVVILNILISCMYKVVFNCQPTTIKLLVYSIQ